MQLFYFPLYCTQRCSTLPITNITQQQLFYELLCCIFGTFHFILQTATISIYQSWNRKIDIVLLIVVLYRDSILRSSDPWPQTRMLNVLCMSKDDNMYVSAQKLRIKTYFLGQVACRVVIWIILNCAHFLYNATWVNMHSKECLKRTRKMYNIEWLGVYCNVFHCSSSRHNIK